MIEKLKEEGRYSRTVEDLTTLRETFWVNPGGGENKFSHLIDDEAIEDAEQRLQRFAPYMEKAFPETRESKGIIESHLKEVPGLKESLSKLSGYEIQGRVLLKCDSHLQVAGSIKARGGIYEVLKFAESIIVENDLLKPGDSYEKIDAPEFKEVFGKYKIAVGSTGNLGLSIGIISAKLGFDVTVHMSSDAKEWKKELLRSKGAKVIEYESAYQTAVAEGRKAAKADPMCHFVDDENSLDLFVGYATAGRRFAKQLYEQGIAVDEEHPLFVYIPCGVGGAPGGVSYGIKKVFGANAHCIFAEPTHAPCMILGMSTGLHDDISVEGIGIDGKTAADGLAVGKPSSLVGRTMETLLDCILTIDDDRLFVYLKALADSEGIFLEPSACATFGAIGKAMQNEDYLEKYRLKEKIKNATHVLWATGGSMVPKEEMKNYYDYALEIWDRA